jgi:hypothetical protein
VVSVNIINYKCPWQNQMDCKPKFVLELSMREPLNFSYIMKKFVTDIKHVSKYLL